MFSQRGILSNSSSNKKVFKSKSKVEFLSTIVIKYYFLYNILYIEIHQKKYFLRTFLDFLIAQKTSFQTLKYHLQKEKIHVL